MLHWNLVKDQGCFCHAWPINSTMVMSDVKEENFFPYGPIWSIVRASDHRHECLSVFFFDAFPRRLRVWFLETIHTGQRPRASRETQGLCTVTGISGIAEFILTQFFPHVIGIFSICIIFLLSIEYLVAQCLAIQVERPRVSHSDMQRAVLGAEDVGHRLICTQ